MKTTLIFLCILFLSINLSAQPTLNQTDANHLKQGKWVGKYPDGTIRYEGIFKDNKPVGELKRYHENGKIKAILVYSPNSDKVKAELFNPEGSMVSRGNFIGTLKDSVWTYYDNKEIAARENYNKGLKNGKSYAYYPDGKTSNESEWVNGKLNRIARDFYPSGEKKSETRYLEGKRQGWSSVYFESGKPQIEGEYDNDQYAGTWKFFNPDGTIKFQLEYKNGMLQNPEALDSLQMDEFKAFDKVKGKIKDPEHYLENPGEYLSK
jgi:antitoxin component YwqK of YwqJK toxin-antitoxin module